MARRPHHLAGKDRPVRSSHPGWMPGYKISAAISKTIEETGLEQGSRFFLVKSPERILNGVYLS